MLNHDGTSSKTWRDPRSPKSRKRELTIKMTKDDRVSWRENGSPRWLFWLLKWIIAPNLLLE